MYIQPSGLIYILHNVEINKDYEHTILFTSKEQQQLFFSGLRKYTLDYQTYTRTGRGSIRVQIKTEDLYDCNYLMFENYFRYSGTGVTTKKWFYAFIDKVEYINNEVSEVFFTIDVMQSWAFDYSIKASFIDRCHVSNDAKYSNLVPEEVSVGSAYHLIDAQPYDFDLNPTGVMFIVTEAIPDGDTNDCVFSTQDGNPETTTYNWKGISDPDVNIGMRAGRLVNKVFTGLYYLYIDFIDTTNGPKLASNVIEAYTQKGKEQSIVTVIMVPSPVLGTNDDGKRSIFSVPEVTDTVFQNRYGWKPNNNKIYNSPYNFVLVSNNSGNTKEYQWEEWASAGRGGFVVYYAPMNSPSCIILPTNYCGIGEDWDNGLKTDSFPVCAYAGDAYKAWWAQNGARIGAQGINATLGLLAGFADAGMRYGIRSNYASDRFENAVNDIDERFSSMGNLQYTRRNINARARAELGAIRNFRDTMTNIGEMGALAAGGAAVGGITRLATTAVDIASSIQSAKAQPNRAYGDTSGSYLQAFTDRIKFSAYRMTLRPDLLKRMDAYFDMYGYAIKQLGTINRAARNYYTYIKTVGCNIQANCPEDDVGLIKAIYDNGITFWRYVPGRDLNVGDYSVAALNTPI